MYFKGEQKEFIAVEKAEEKMEQEAIDSDFSIYLPLTIFLTFDGKSRLFFLGEIIINKFNHRWFFFNFLIRQNEEVRY